MVDRVFDFDIKAEPTGTAAYRTLDAQFGDGYVQMAADGINAVMLTYQVGMIGSIKPGCSKSMVAEASAFLDERAGWQSFQWTPPGYSIPFRWVAKGKTYNHRGNNVFELKANFVQVPFP